MGATSRKRRSLARRQEAVSVKATVVEKAAKKTKKKA